MNNKAKTFAQNNGMRLAHGIAYGSLQGYAATLYGEDGETVLELTAKIADPAEQTALLTEVNQKDLTKEYWAVNFRIEGGRIYVNFRPASKTEQMQAFADWFLPLLKQHGAVGMTVCSQCGMELTQGKWILAEGTARYVHPACVEKLRESINGSELPKKTSYVTGLVGALLGALLGAIVWGIVLKMGYVAAIVGFLVGWLAEKGYNLLRGKQGKGKIAILIVAIIFGVFVGTFLPDVVDLVTGINDGTFYFEYTDIPAAILLVLQESEEYRMGVIANIGLGLVFAALGVFTLLKRTGKDIANQRFIELDQ